MSAPYYPTNQRVRLRGDMCVSVTKHRSHVGKIISRREPSVQLEGSRTGTSRFGSGVYNTTLTSNNTTMADPEKQLEQPKANQQKMVIANKVTGTVKWFNVKSGYGFINRNDIKEDVFVHQSAIVKNNPKKAVRSVGDGEIVEFDVVIGEKGHEAANVTGPDGEPVRGSPYAADKRRGYRTWYNRPRGGGGLRSQRRPREGQEGYESGDGKQVEDSNIGEGNQRRYRPRRNYDGYYRGGRRSGPSNQQHGENGGEGGGAARYDKGEQSGGEGNNEGGGPPRSSGRGRGSAPRRFYRRNFRGGRGGGGPPRRPRSQDNQVSEEDNGGGRNSVRSLHPHFRRRITRNLRYGNPKFANIQHIQPFVDPIYSTHSKIRPEAGDSNIKEPKSQVSMKLHEPDVCKKQDTPAVTSLQDSQAVQNTISESNA